ncbi:MAG: GNAT family N-acetyltransferase [Alphaproteobacteria bacterium]
MSSRPIRPVPPAPPASPLPGDGAVPAPIETPRLTLRYVDAALARALHGDRRLAGRLAGGMLHRDFPDSGLAGMLPGYASGLEAEPEAGGWGLWLLVYRPERLVVGGIGFKGRPSVAGEVAIGYDIVRPHRRRGLAVEGTEALIRWAFLDSLVGRVLADCRADNVASVGVLQRLGFVELPGNTPAMLRWEMPRSVWQRRYS